MSFLTNIFFKEASFQSVKRTAGIFDGDLVFIRQQSSVRNGKIAAVRLTDWNEASLKKIFVKNDNVILYPCNPDYEPIVTRNVEIIGECVGVYREL